MTTSVDLRWYLSRMSDETQDRFQRLLDPLQSGLRAYIQRMIGPTSDAEDLYQEVILKAWQQLDTLREDRAFRSWLYQIATRSCLDHLRTQARWRPHSQVHLEEACHADENLKAQVEATAKDPESSFDVHEHIAFCFTCVARSLDPLPQAAVILREMISLTHRESADLLGISESKLRHVLRQGRTDMITTYEGLCSLVNKQGICRQCAGFRGVTTPTRRGPELPVIPDWQSRVDLVRNRPDVRGVSHSLHSLLFALIQQLELVNRRAENLGEPHQR